MNELWGIDITYIRMKDGWLHLVAVIDWMSRFVLFFELSTTLEIDFRVHASERALEVGTSEIFSSHQESQFTSLAFGRQLGHRNIQISIGGRCRAMDNVFKERLWHSVKYEEVYINKSKTVRDAKKRIDKHVSFYS